MSEGSGPYVVYNVLAIVLVLSSLVAMRLPLGKAAKMAAGWVLIFGVAFSLFTFRSEIKSFGSRLYASAFGEPIEIEGGEMRIEMAEDGHFWVRGQVNDASVRFLVDSGATTTTLSSETAAAAGVQAGNRRQVVNTANGQILVSQADAASLRIGSIVRQDFPVAISENDATNILGMNFLSSLKSWRVENGELILRA